MRWTVLTITLLAMTMFVVGLTQAAVSNDEPYDDIRLYFHSDGSDSVGQYNMSTWGPGSGDAGNINVGSGAEETRDYILNKSLQYDLVVIGKDLGGARGFRAIIIIDCDDIEPGDNTDAQVSVLEKRGTNETLVAESTRASHQTTWDIPFVESGMKRYTFRAGSEIIFRITVRSSATLGGTCSVGTNGDYYLNLTCSPVELRFNVNTYDYTDDGDHTGTGVDVFQVNLPYDIQYMNISGEVRNAFGSYDVQEVNLTLERIGTDPAVIFKDRTTIHLNSYLDDGVYRFFDQWFWPSNITPTDPKSGSEGYRLTMSFRNRDNVTFTNTNNSVHLDFLQYAVYMRFWDPVDQMWKEQIARTGEANSTLDVEVTVYNTGTDEETVNLDASNFKVAQGWSVELDTESVIISAGDNTTVTATVSIPDADPGDMDTIQIEATIEESDYKFDVQFTVTATGVIDFDFYPPGNTTAHVREGESGLFRFQLINRGTEDLIFDYDTDPAPEDLTHGWEMSFDPEPPTDTIEGGNSVYFNITITAPDSVSVSTPRRIDMTVEAWPVGHADMAQNIDIVVILDTYKIIPSPPTSSDKICKVVDTDPYFRYDSAVFDLTVYNGEEDEVDVEITINYDKNKSNIDAMNWDVDGLDTFRLDAGDTRTVTITFTPVGDDVDPGSYYAEIDVSLVGRKSEATTVNFKVERWVAQDVQVSSGTSFDVKHGDTIEVTFTITNMGNDVDDFQIQVTGVTTDWEVRIAGVAENPHTIQGLAPGADTTVTVDLVPPKEAAGEKFDINIRVQPSPNVVGVVEDIQVTVDVKDLEPGPEQVLEQMLPLFIIFIAFGAVFYAYRRKTRQRSA